MDLAGYNRKGRLFTASNVAAKSVIAVTTAMTGLILYNPLGSGRKALLAHAGWVWTTAPAAVHNIGIALAKPHPTVPSSLTDVGSGVLLADGTGNAGDAKVKAYDAATLVAAPVIQRWMFGATYGSGVGESPGALMDYIDGGIILVPGATATFAAVTTTAVGMGSLCWAEVDA